ncbi:urease accessory protein UreE [Novosphingobium profundi]|uniref:urease accessory protein UreE n=1 Tax=Novosphingobium profundi TaxID=1774954 RepID=UPI001BD970C9|nr:urease accessory protein UreE [Novosphingobium profundi]
MNRILHVLPRDGANPPANDHVSLDHDRRRRRRMVHTTAGGRAILLDMGNVVHLRDGDRLELDDGSVIEVRAVPEALVAITAPDTAALVRIAWHLGNRHLPTQLDGETLLIREDHVIVDMVKGLGGVCTPRLAPFDPEGGAYEGGGHGHGHDHVHSHSHAHAHG